METTIKDILGTVSPPCDELAEIYKVSRVTLRKVLDQLSDEGLIERREGKGTFVAGSEVRRKLGISRRVQPQTLKIVLSSREPMRLKTRKADPINWFVDQDILKGISKASLRFGYHLDLNFVSGERKLGFKEFLGSGKLMGGIIFIQEGDKEIYITTELPGVEKEDIVLEILDNILYIQVVNDKYPYKKEIELKTSINEKNIDATYNNGILSITLQKNKPKKKGKKINIK